MIRSRAVCAVSLFALLTAAFAQNSAPPPTPTTVIEDVFREGVMVRDANGDKIADALCGHVIVPKSPGVEIGRASCRERVWR